MFNPAAPAQGPPDTAVPNTQSDTIQCLNWSPRANHLVAGAWDGVVRFWDVTPSGIAPKAEQKFDGPVLDVSWSDDGSKVYGASCDTSVRMWDLASNQLVQVAKHEAPIKSCIWIPSIQGLMTASWDKTVKFWDCRQPQPVFNVQTPERCFAADAADNIAIVALANMKVMGFTLQGGIRQVYIDDTKKLKFPPRCVAVLPSRDGFAVGTVEGRVGIQHFDATKAADNFTFKCHNDNDNFYCVNSMSFHPRFGTFATCGSDAKFIFWDKNSRMRLKAFNPAPAPLTCCRFNADGTLLAYSYGYDWHKGYAQPPMPTGILIHPTPDAEIQSRPAAARPAARR